MLTKLLCNLNCDIENEKSAWILKVQRHQERKNLKLDCDTNFIDETIFIF